MDASKHLAKVTKVAEKHGFSLVSVTPDVPSLGNHSYTAYLWTRPAADERTHKITLWIWDNGTISLFYRFHQTNKIYAPCTCDNANQLDRAVTSDALRSDW